MKSSNLKGCFLRDLQRLRHFVVSSCGLAFLVNPVTAANLIWNSSCVYTMLLRSK